MCLAATATGAGAVFIQWKQRTCRPRRQAVLSERGVLMKLLAVVPYLPAPTWGGGARSFYVLKALANKYLVSLLALNRGTDSRIAASCRPLLERLQRVEFVPYPLSHWRRWRQALNIVRRESSAIADRCPPGLQAALDRALASDHYQAIYVDGALTAAGLHLPLALP